MASRPDRYIVHDGRAPSADELPVSAHQLVAALNTTYARVAAYYNGSHHRTHRSVYIGDEGKSKPRLAQFDHLVLRVPQELHSQNSTSPPPRSPPHNSPFQQRTSVYQPLCVSAHREIYSQLHATPPTLRFSKLQSELRHSCFAPH